MSNLPRKTDTYFKHHKTENSIDEITYNDLNLDEVFSSVNKTVSSLGEEVLYYSFRNPALNKTEIDNLADRLSYLNNNEELCKDVRSKLKELNKLKKISIFEYLYYLDNIDSISYLKLIINPLIMCIAVGCLFLSSNIGIYLLIAAYIYNTIIYFKRTAEIKPFITSFAYINKSIKLGKNISLLKNSEYNSFESISRFSFILGNLSGVTANGGSGNPFDLVLDLIKMGFHLDVIKFYSMLHTVKIFQNDIESFLYHIGRIDADISILEYRKENDFFCIPEFIDSKKITVENLIHPLIDKPVKNSVDTSNGVLITGSNASGKSTFLRSVAISAIMAQSMYTVLAESYSAPFFRILSCMDISDSIILGDSYFMSEIKAVKRIVDISKANEDNYVLCFIDELLKGTNTIERISAGCKILEYINNERTLCFAATHDRELTILLKDSYCNYHFEETMNGEDISFSYRIMGGPSVTTNAISLLKNIGFPDEIVNGAVDLTHSLKL